MLGTGTMVRWDQDPLPICKRSGCHSGITQLKMEPAPVDSGELHRGTNSVLLVARGKACTGHKSAGISPQSHLLGSVSSGGNSVAKE